MQTKIQEKLKAGEQSVIQRVEASYHWKCRECGAKAEYCSTRNPTRVYCAGHATAECVQFSEQPE